MSSSSRRQRWTVVAVGLAIALAVVLLLRCRASSTPAGTAPTARGPVWSQTGDRSSTTAETVPRWFLRPWGKASEVAGTVFRDAKPASGVAVTLRSSLTLAGIQRERTLRSGADGRFSFGVLPPARYTVTASEPDRIAARVDVDLGRRNADPRPDQLELYLGRCEGRVHGFVRDASGGVVQGASVGTNVIGLYAARETQTDEHGEYSLCVTQGINAISVAASGYGVVERVIVVVGTRRLDVALSPAAIIEGTVVDPAGMPVDQAAVRVIGRTDEVDRLGSMIVVTDAQGHFHLETAAGAGTLLAVDHESSSDRVAVEVKPGEIVQGVVLRLLPRASVRGQVRMNGAPAAGIELQLFSDHGFAETVSDSDGSFVVAAAPIGAVEVSSPTHRVVSGGAIAVPVGGADHVAIEVAPLASIAGRIERLGAPAVAARVALRSPGRSWETISDLRGAFRVAGLAAGTYELSISEDGARARAPTMSIEIADGEDRDVGTIQLTIAGRIAGRVVDDTGQPVAAAYVSAGSVGDDDGAAITDDAGSFTIAGLSLGPHGMTVRLRGAALEQVGEHRPIELTPLQPEISGLTIRVRMNRARITGRVVDAAGTPLPDVAIQVLGEGDRRSWSFVTASAITGVDGRFSAEELANGRYTIRASQRGGGDAVVNDVVAPREGLEIALAPQGAIEGRLEQFTGSVDVVINSATDHRSRRALVDGDHFTLQSVPAGDYLVVARGDNAMATALVHVTPPEVARPVLRAQAARRVTGIVRELSSKAPVPGMVCAAGPRANPAARVWYSTAPSGPDGRFDIAIGAEEVAVTCDGGATFVFAARGASGPAVELWTIRRSDHALTSIGASLASDPLVPRVDRVAEGSVAQRAGLLSGDVVVAIGDQPLDGIGTDVAVELWRQRLAAGPIAVTVLRGDKLVTLRFTQT